MHPSTLATTLLLVAPAFAQHSTVPVFPDLVIEKVQAPARIQGGAVMQISATVQNRGTGNAAATEVAVFLSSDAKLDHGDALIQRMGLRALAPGQRSTALGWGFVPACAPASMQYVLFLVDPEQVLPEKDRSNNFRDSKQPLDPYAGDSKRIELHPSLQGPAPKTHYARIDLSSERRRLDMCLTARKLPGWNYLLYWSADKFGAYDAYSELGLTLIATPGFATWIGTLDQNGQAFPFVQLPKLSVRKRFDLYTFGLFFRPGQEIESSTNKLQLIFEAAN